LWLRVLGPTGLSFVVLFIAEVIWNWKTMPFGDNVARSILIAALWSLLFACCDAVFIRLVRKSS
jgi:hypothetical protein